MTAKVTLLTGDCRKVLHSLPNESVHFATFPPSLAGCPKGGTVLDPFGGSGTVGMVAQRLHRKSVLIDLNPIYIEMARGRIIGDAPFFNTVQVDASRSKGRQT